MRRALYVEIEGEALEILDGPAYSPADDEGEASFEARVRCRPCDRCDDLGAREIGLYGAAAEEAWAEVKPQLAPRRFVCVWYVENSVTREVLEGGVRGYDVPAEIVSRVRKLGGWPFVAVQELEMEPA